MFQKKLESAPRAERSSFCNSDGAKFLLMTKRLSQLQKSGSGARKKAPKYYYYK